MGNVECTSCHNPHVQAIDKLSMNFLVRDSSNGQMCLACHDPDAHVDRRQEPGQSAGRMADRHSRDCAEQSLGTGEPRQLWNGRRQRLHFLPCAAQRFGSHAPAACSQRGRIASACHSGGSNLSPAAPNIFAEYSKIGHPFPSGTNTHDAAEPAVLNNNRHATCADCHNGHGSQQVTSFNIPPIVRVSQTGAVGVGVDGTTVVNPAVNQYENCLRCHGSSSGKVANPIYGYFPLRGAAAIHSTSFRR